MSTEVATGYKNTEAGKIPEAWEAKSLGQVISLQRGHDLTHRERRKGAVPVMGSAGQNGVHDTALAKAPGVVLGRSGASFGQAHYCGQDFWPHNTALYVTDFHGNDQLFTFYFLKSIDFSRHNSGGAQQSLNRNFIYPIKVGIPSLDEQRAIATALSDMDALVSILDQLIAKKRDIKQATMQQLLTGQKRLPPFNSKKQNFKKTPVGRFPGDWEVSPLIDLVDPERSIRYGIVQPGEYDQSGRYMIRGQDYSEAKGWAKPSEVFRVSAAVEARYQNARVKAGDLIMTIVGYCGHVELIPSWLDGANLTQTTARIAIKPDRAISTFCKYFLQCSAGRAQVAAYMKGAAQPGLNCGDVERFLIVAPSLPEQAAIAGILLDMDAELAAIESRLGKAKQIKQGMMQELLTGKIRLL